MVRSTPHPVASTFILACCRNPPRPPSPALLDRACGDERGRYEPPVPSPPATEVEAAKALGIDERTGRDTQPEWLSVLKKRAVPWMWLRCLRSLTLNCCFQPRWTLTRAVAAGGDVASYVGYRKGGARASEED